MADNVARSAQDNTMSGTPNGELFDVVGNHVRAAFEHRFRLGRPKKRLRTSRADTECQSFVRPRLLDNGKNIVE